MRTAPMFRRTLTGALLAVLAGSTLVATPSATADGDDTPAAARAKAGKYVALGDSFASGPQIEPMQTTEPAHCARSTKNYASVIAGTMTGTTFVDATCSGAKLTHLWAAKDQAPPQLDAVTRDATLVTFGTLGGNDVGLVDIATSCVLGECAGGEGDENHQKIEATRALMRKGVRDVKKKAPKATIVMVGYGTYLPPGGCPETMPYLTAEEADYLQGLIDHLSDVIGEVAAQQNVLFADQRTIPDAVDHTACADFADQWIRGVDIGDGTDGAMLHPSAAGMAATATLLTTTLKQGRQQAKAAKKSVKFTATCKKRAKKATFRVRGGKASVERAVVKVGKRKVKADKKAPFLVKAKAKKLRKVKGKPTAVVHLDVKSVHVTRTVKAKRPGCLRR